MFEKICTILADFTKVSADQMTENTDLRNELEMNSLDTLDAVVKLEEEFDIEIPDRKISDFHTIKDIVDYISNQ